LYSGRRLLVSKLYYLLELREFYDLVFVVLPFIIIFIKIILVTPVIVILAIMLITQIVIIFIEIIIVILQQVSKRKQRLQKTSVTPVKAGHMAEIRNFKNTDRMRRTISKI